MSRTSSDYSDIICKALSSIAKNENKNSDSGRTIKARIKTVSNPAIGKYMISYEAADFYAISANQDVEYNVGQLVYVHQPSGGSNEGSIILCAAETPNVLDTIANRIKYTDLSKNLIQYQGVQDYAIGIKLKTDEDNNIIGRDFTLVNKDGVSDNLLNRYGIEAINGNNSFKLSDKQQFPKGANALRISAIVETDFAKSGIEV